MSTVKESIQVALKEAMRARDKKRTGTLRLVMSEVKKIEVDERIDVDDQRMLAILDKMRKQRLDSIAQYESANRDDLAQVEKDELDIIGTFLPQPLTESEITALVDQAIADSGASSMQDMGKVMSLVKPQVQGRADMGQVSQLVKAGLSR